MLAWLMVGEMLRVDCLKSQESGRRTKQGGLYNSPSTHSWVRYPLMPRKCTSSATGGLG